MTEAALRDRIDYLEAAKLCFRAPLLLLIFLLVLFACSP